jgi:uncharacterized membrane protein
MKSLMSLILVLAAVVFTGCGKVDSMMDMPNKMDTMVNKMGKLEDKTTQGVMEAKLLDDKNYETLSPAPYDLMVPASLFTEHLSAVDLVKWFDVQLNKVNGAMTGDQFADVKSPEALKYEHNKLGTFVMLTAVAGLMPDSTTQKIAAKVQHGDDKRTTMLAMLSMRAHFIESVLMKEYYAPPKLVGIGEVEEAIKANQSLEYVLRLPFVAKVLVKTTGFMENDQNDEMSFGTNIDAAKNGWLSIADGLNRYAQVNQFSGDQSQVDDQNRRQAAAFNVVNAGLTSWGAAPFTFQLQ